MTQGRIPGEEAHEGDPLLLARILARLRPTGHAPRAGNVKKDSDRAMQGDGGIQMNPGRGGHPAPQKMGPKASRKALGAFLPGSRRVPGEVIDGAKGTNANIRINVGGNEMIDTEGRESNRRSERGGNIDRSLGEPDQKVGIEVEVPWKGNQDEPAVDDGGGLPRSGVKSRRKRVSMRDEDN